MKKQPTVINFKWQMSWIENEEIAHRPMKWFEYIRYFPRIMIREWVTGYEFPKTKEASKYIGDANKTIHIVVTNKMVE